MPCSYSHKCMSRDDSWRDLPEKFHKWTSSKLGIPEVIPLATNGIIVYAKLANGQEFICQLSNLNLALPEGFSAKRKAPTIKEVCERKPRVLREAKPVRVIDLSDFDL